KCKVIRTPGSHTERVAQACDRCRSKKTRCDGKRPQCSQCAAVGFECKISDRLSRRAFPRGYTETLEERVRELEAENKKFTSDSVLQNPSIKEEIDETNTNLLNSKNLHLLEKTNPPCDAISKGFLHSHEPHHAGCNCCASYPHSVHERPVSIAGSVNIDAGMLTDEEDADDVASLISFSDSSNFNNHNHNSLSHNHRFKQNHFISSNSSQNSLNPPNFHDISFEQTEAPGIEAALAIRSSKSEKNNAKNVLTNLVALSIPRSTEETLFIPSLIAKICDFHGLNSKPAFLAAKSIALLKEHNNNNNNNNNNDDDHNMINIKNINFNNITKSESYLFFTNLKLPKRIDLDQLITFYFQEWGMILSIIDQNHFLKYYVKLTKSLEMKFNDNSMFHDEKFGAILVLVLSLAMLEIETNTLSPNSSLNFLNSSINSQSNTNKLNENDSTAQLLRYYDNLIHQFISSSIVKSSSIQSLQILTLALLYCVNIGDADSTYLLRGKVISMAQQLRLHRCPSAVLGTNGSTVSKFLQSERRILFWCIYSLDVFSALQLGVPRLLKDYEIECALPFSNDDLNDDNNINVLIINNSKLPLVGKVCNLALAVMRFSKILGNIVDTIFKRGGVALSSLDKTCIIHENLLDNWRRDLPPTLKFELDVNGLLKNNEFQNLNFKILSLIILYYEARMLIYLPNLASEIYNSRGSAAYITIQQSTNIILNITNFLSTQKNYFPPIPVNLPRVRSRLSLMGAKGALEYARGGNLFQESKTLLTTVINDLRRETSIGLPGCLSHNCINFLDEAIQAILQPPKSASAGNYINSIVNNNNRNSKLVKKKSPLRKTIDVTTI
ncbi:DNA-binding transcription factor CAT8 ASCRUDRAFT_21169, partial [Ascoidea rubescens DSM 1968]